jgi:hypothetical protein
MLLVLSSDLEGLSLALLDAMGAGVCGLAVEVPQNRELVKDEGFTFERGSAAYLAGMIPFRPCESGNPRSCWSRGEQADSQPISLPQGGYGYCEVLF